MATYMVETQRLPFGGPKGGQKLDFAVHKAEAFSADVLSPSMTAVFEVEHCRNATEAVTCIMEYAAGLGPCVRLRFGGKVKPKTTPMTPRANAPTERTDAGEEQAFRVWAHQPSYLEDTQPWKCLAAFRFLQECLDYLAYCRKRGGDVVFQSPAETRVEKCA
jgi:hypothetical protein